MFPRKNGILLHPTSLPGPYGMGEIGQQAHRFLDVLERMGQGLWQVLPLGPTGYADSPYQSLSTFAGNTQMICLESLVADRLLRRAELQDAPSFPATAVDYGAVIPWRAEKLTLAAMHFDERASAALRADFARFENESADWLPDYALFSALKQAHDLRPWTEWPEPVAQRRPKALAAAVTKYADPIRRECVLQFLFARQWSALRSEANKRGIEMVGDIPIFVAHDSADVWANPELFYLDETGRPTVIAGVPPDYFSVTGQRWGNPLYRWDRHEADDFAWWKKRIRAIFALVDIVRIDHFRGFESYWEIPASEETAVKGRWVPAPGIRLFDSLRRELGVLPVIAEDLGVITPEVEELRDRYEFPGMRIAQFAFGNDDQADAFKPHNYPENCVAYTGTHDNDTTVGWFNSKPGEGSIRTEEDIAIERARVMKYMGTNGSHIQWDLISKVLGSQARTTVIPMQDVLGLGSEARMNTPGTTSGNWRWRFQWDDLSETLTQRLLDTTRWASRTTTPSA